MMRLGFMATILALAGILYSCSDANTKPNFQYKKSSGDGVAAKMGDIIITEKELNSGIETEIFEAEQKVFDIKFDRVKTLVLEKLMDKDPRKKGLTNDEYMDKYIAKSINISESDIQNFIKERKIPEAQINDMIKERIKEFLTMEKKRGAVDQWLAEQTQKNAVEIFLEKPRRPTFDIAIGTSPSSGSKDAPVTIVEFSDFQCPFCSKATAIVQELKKKYGKKLNVVFKQFPLPFHKDAKRAAMASLCANEQSNEKFWKLHDWMFDNQDKLSKELIQGSAGKLGLDQKKFNECLDGNKYLAAVNEDIDHGKDVGVKSTPTFFINGQLINGAQPIEVFEELIQEALSN